MLNNFETFLSSFAEAFGDDDKIRWKKTKIRALQKGVSSACAYAFDFWQLACNINWDEQALISQFH